MVTNIRKIKVFNEKYLENGAVTRIFVNFVGLVDMKLPAKFQWSSNK